LFGRNLTLLGEWLSILFKRNLSQKELNTSGGVVKHPENIKEEYFKRNLTLLQKWLSILFIFIFTVIFTFIYIYISKICSGGTGYL
jgi:hypothetical protein